MSEEEVHWISSNFEPSPKAETKLNTTNPYTFRVTQEEWDKLNKALNEPTQPSVAEGLKRLFGKNEQ